MWLGEPDLVKEKILENKKEKKLTKVQLNEVVKIKMRGGKLKKPTDFKVVMTNGLSVSTCLAHND